jgi:hypothetical protein
MATFNPKLLREIILMHSAHEISWLAVAVTSLVIVLSSFFTAIGPEIARETRRNVILWALSAAISLFAILFAMENIDWNAHHPLWQPAFTIGALSLFSFLFWHYRPLKPPYPALQLDHDPLES